MTSHAWSSRSRAARRRGRRATGRGAVPSAGSREQPGAKGGPHGRSATWRRPATGRARTAPPRRRRQPDDDGGGGDGTARRITLESRCRRPPTVRSATTAHVTRALTTPLHDNAPRVFFLFVCSCADAPTRRQAPVLGFLD